MQTLQQDLQLNKGLIPEKNSIKKERGFDLSLFLFLELFILRSLI